MIFVNDIAGVPGTPAWLKHFEPSAGDGMTIVDVVFPAFLFIVGLAIPLAFRARARKGESVRSTVGHTMTRTLSLLVIGVLMVNSGNESAQGLINPHLWTLLMYAGVFLVWVRWRPAGGHHERAQQVMVLIGFTLILATVAVYRADDVSGWFQIRPRWWGILGLIGWAYLVSSAVYLLARGKKILVLAGAVALFALYIGIESGVLSPIEEAVPFMTLSYTLGSHAALVLFGVFMGYIFLPESSLRDLRQRSMWGLAYAAVLAIAGWLLYLPHETYPFLIINKNMGTPPWCLFSAAITAVCLVIISWLVDRNRHPQRESAAELAGRNALFAYILAPFVYACFAWISDLTGTTNLMSLLASPFPVGLGRAIALSLLVMGVAAWLSKRGIALKI
jgi:predicted acyltransferase